MYNLDEEKKVIDENKLAFIDFVKKCLDTEEFINCVNALLPFDKFAQAKLRIVNDASRVKSLGMSIMRIEFEPALFSLGINIEIVEREHGCSQNQTVFVSACQSMDDLRRYAKSDDFATAVTEHFENCIHE